MTSAALLSRLASESLRSLSMRESRLTPSKVGPSCGEIRSMVSDNVFNDWLSMAVSVSAVLAVKSLSDCVSEYGEPVRDTGITSDAFSVPLPSDSNVSTRWPSRVPVRMWAVVSEPRRTPPLTRKVTSALPRCSATSDTVPTLTPDTFTSLPGTRPPASLNTAWCLIDVAQEISLLRRKPHGDDEQNQYQADEAGPDE